MIDVPPRDFTFLWNDDTSKEERKRLMPHMIESQILHIWQTKEIAIRHHKEHMEAIDSQIKNLLGGLDREVGSWGND